MLEKSLAVSEKVLSNLAPMNQAMPTCPSLGFIAHKSMALGGGRHTIRPVIVNKTASTTPIIMAVSLVDKLGSCVCFALASWDSFLGSCRGNRVSMNCSI